MAQRRRSGLDPGPMLKGVLTVGGWTMASRVLGFARDMLIASRLGAGPMADAFFVALIDLGFVGALIGGIVTLRGIANADCSSFSSGSLYFDLGPFGYYGRQSDSPWSVNINKTCAMLKASWALAIIATLTFFVTFVSLASWIDPHKTVH